MASSKIVFFPHTKSISAVFSKPKSVRLLAFLPRHRPSCRDFTGDVGIGHLQTPTMETYVTGVWADMKLKPVHQNGTIVRLKLNQLGGILTETSIDRNAIVDIRAPTVAGVVGDDFVDGTS